MAYGKRRCNVCGDRVTTNALGRASHMRACYARKNKERLERQAQQDAKATAEQSKPPEEK